MKHYDCIVVGGGMSGLSTAYALLQRNVDVLLIEAGANPGGSMQSERTPEGFVLEHGPNTVTSKDPELWAHFESLGLEEQRLVADRAGGRRYILLDGKPTLIPTAPPALIASPLLSPLAKLRVLAEPLIPRGPTEDESVFSFFARRLGYEPASRLLDPFVSGVYAGDPRSLSVRSAFPSIWEAEQRAGSVILGMISGSKPKNGAAKEPKAAKKPRQRSVLFSFEDGLNTWPQAITRALGERCWLNMPTRALRPAPDGWILTVEQDGKPVEVSAGQVVLAAPAFVAAELVKHIDQRAAAAMRGMYYPPLTVVHVGYRREDVEHPLDGFGLLCPSGEQRDILGMLWPSSLFPGRAPAGTVLTTNFVGGARRPELARLPDDELQAMVMREQQAMIGARGKPVMFKAIRWKRAISQYNAGHAHRIALLEQLEQAQPGLYLAGNYRDGVSVEKCWKRGNALAERIARRSQSKRGHAASNQKVLERSTGA